MNETRAENFFQTFNSMNFTAQAPPFIQWRSEAVDLPFSLAMVSQKPLLENIYLDGN